MHPAAFEYVRAGSAGEALAALAEHGDEAKLLAGGHSLLPLMKLRLATPSVLVDIGELDDLAYVREDGDVLAVGALTRHVALETDATVRGRLPLLAEVAHVVGDPQVRNRGTLGGSLAHGDPASDLPAATLALDATFVVEGPRGRREIAAPAFFTGFLETAVEPDELLVEVRFPLAHDEPPAGAYHKLTRRSQDWAVVAAAASRVPGTANEARVALVNMGPVPQRAPAVEAALASGASAAEAAELAAEHAAPSADIHASVDYRRHLARVLVRRALTDAGLT
ncbi:MAG: xanthine dehydrogenase family protein subunit M [Acidimicrobiales bacterium]